MVDQITPERVAEADHSDELAGIELHLLLEAVVRWGGYDFREYTPATLNRRVAERMRAESVATISGLQERFLHDHEALRRFVFALSSSSSRPFEPPEYFRAIVERVVPLLRTYSFARIWFPACSTGEDIYTLSALLLEAGILERCMIYATDLSDLALAQAREGSYEVASSQAFAANYQLSGGGLSIASFCDLTDRTVRFHEALRKNVIFAQHSLATGSSLNEFHTIVARGVLSPFNKTLQYRVHNLFLQSLARLGFLCLGPNESLRATPHEGVFRQIDDSAPLYRRMR